MAGYHGHRILTPNTAILSHQYSWGSVGKSHELIAATKAFDLTSTMLMNHYKKCSNLDEDQINKFLLPASDCWLSPQEALNYGLCDEIKELN
jgi:ATP-dependent protease ClpP protease subunit